MHSRIIELSKDPILKHERMCESSVPDWFYHSIADYTDADTDRDHDIKWFLDAVARVVDVAEDGKSFTFKPKAKQKYFERQYHAFLDKACELTGISLDAFVGETKYDIGMAMYKLNEHYQEMISRIACIAFWPLMMNRPKRRSIASSRIGRTRQKPTTRLTPCVSSGTRTALYARSTTASSPISSISTKM